MEVRLFLRKKLQSCFLFIFEKIPYSCSKLTLLGSLTSQQSPIVQRMRAASMRQSSNFLALFHHAIPEFLDGKNE